MKFIQILGLLLLVGSCATSTVEEEPKDDPATALMAPADSETDVPQDPCTECDERTEVLPLPTPSGNTSSAPQVVDQFTEPSCLASAVDFWAKVYSIYSRNQIIIHHDRTFEIYHVADVPAPEHKKARQKAVKSLLDQVRSRIPEKDRDSVRAQSGVRERFMEGIVLGREHIPLIQERLKQANLPTELVFIPLIESGFQPSALSKVGARGYWQIMPGTLRLYTKANKKKLSDLNFSTQIAILILQDSYNALGSWPLAINAYHSGIGRIRKAVQQLQSQDICAVVTQYDGKGYKFASRNYYAQFLAAKRLYEAGYQVTSTATDDKDPPAWGKENGPCGGIAGISCESNSLECKGAGPSDQPGTCVKKEDKKKKKHKHKHKSKKHKSKKHKTKKPSKQ